MSLSPFHLAIPVYDLPAARFYGEVFGLPEGRSSTQWVDFDFYGHQLVIHEHPRLSPRTAPTPIQSTATTSRCRTSASCSHGRNGSLAERLKSFGTEFVIEPYIRFKGRWASRPPCSCSTPAAMRWSSRLSRT
jgi:extradiol dioxygenase family protein